LREMTNKVVVVVCRHLPKSVNKRKQGTQRRRKKGDLLFCLKNSIAPILCFLETFVRTRT
jgi:hypothetical protein